MPVFLVGGPRSRPWFVLLLLISALAAASMPVHGLERLQVTIDGQPVRESISMSYSGPEGDPVSSLTVKVTGVSGAVRFVIDPANPQGCKSGEWEHHSRELMVAHDEQTNYYRAPASDWHPCSSVRLGVIHDGSGQQVWWAVNFQGATDQPSKPPRERELNVTAYDGTDTVHMPLTFWVRLTEGGTPVKGERVEFKFDPVGVKALADKYAVWDAKKNDWTSIGNINLASDTTDKSAVTDENGLVIIRAFFDYERMRMRSIKLPFSLEFSAMASPGATPMAPLEKKASLNIANGVFLMAFYYITPQGVLKYVSDLDDVSDYTGQVSAADGDWKKEIVAGISKSEDRDPPRSRVLEKIQLQPDGLSLPGSRQFYLPVKSGQTLVMDAAGGFQGPIPPDAGLAADVMWLDGTRGLFAVNNRDAENKGSFLAVKLMGDPSDKSLSERSRWISFVAGQGTDWVVKTAVVAGATFSGGPVAGTCAAYILESYQAVMDLKEFGDIMTQNARLILINSTVSLTSEPDGKMTLYTFEGTPSVVDGSGLAIVAEENQAIDFIISGGVFPPVSREPPVKALSMLAAMAEDVPYVEEGAGPKDESGYSGENPPTSKEVIPSQESSWEPVPEGENIALGKPASQSSTAVEWGGNWDASRGVDGVKTGDLFEGGFHTENEQNPWWQVDLGSIYEIAEVRIYNRLDCCSDRAKTIEVLLSEDGESWRTVYSHDGRIFGGADGKPLRVRVEGEEARYVRAQLAEKNWLHLDEVEVYREGSSWDGTDEKWPGPATVGNGDEEGSKAEPLNQEGLSSAGLNSDILGQWTIYSGGQVGAPEEWDARYRGTLTLVTWQGTYQGTIMYDIYQTEEELTDVIYENGVLRFTRPPLLGRDVPQFFEAHVEGDKMEGIFSEEGDSRQWRWWGTLDSTSNQEIEVFL